VTRAAACGALVALALAPAASADDAALLRAKARFLPAALRAYDRSPDGLQARYEAGRELEEAVRAARRVSRGCLPLARQLLALARAQALAAEAYDHRPLKPAPARRPVTAGCTPGRPSNSLLQSVVRSAPLPAGGWRARLPGATDGRLAARLAKLGRSFDGWAGFWVHDLRTGRTAGWNADARFPAASTVKLGAIVAALRSRRASLRYDVRQIGAWSSNLASNRIAGALGYGAVTDGLRRLGMVSSTYPGAYRAGTAAAVDAPKPPPHGHTRVTTARDLGRALLRLHAAALGRHWALAATGLTRSQAGEGLSALLRSRPDGENAGILRPWLASTPLAQKNGWLSDTRVTAAIVYRVRGPVIVVVEAYLPELVPAEARRLGRQVVAAVGVS
jgi:beta-lactamase family protein